MNRRAKACTAGGVASNAQLLIGHVLARAAARPHGTRWPRKCTQPDRLAARQVDLSKCTVDEAVLVRICRRVARDRGELNVKVDDPHGRMDCRAGVDIANGRWRARVWTLIAEIAMQQVHGRKVHVDAIPDAREERRRRWRGSGRRRRRRRRRWQHRRRRGRRRRRRQRRRWRRRGTQRGIARKHQVAAGTVATPARRDSKGGFDVSKARPEEELHATARLFISKREWVRWIASQVGGVTACLRAGERALLLIHYDGRADERSRRRAQWSLVIFIRRHCEPLNHCTVEARVEVKDSQRR